MLAETALKQTPLDNDHVSSGAKMVPFGGWHMPLQYEGILSEYHATRRAVSVFDTSHMGEFFIEGDVERCGLDVLVTQPLKDMAVKTCRYGLMLNDNGGVIDDLIVYRLAQERWMLVVNGATTDKDAAQALRHVAPAQFSNRSSQIGKLDIQGPRSREILKDLIKGIERLPYYAFDEFDVLGERVIVSRTGYTGELGFEIYFPWEKTPELWRRILKSGAQPAGLGARDVLRIEMGYSLYGHELEEDISPLEAGLNRFIDWEKDFAGKKALLAQQQLGIKRKGIAFVSQTRRSPRAGHKIYSPQGSQIGVVTSGTFSPALERGIGLGFVAGGHEDKGRAICFGEGENKIPAEIASRPFYKKGTFRN